MLALAGLVTLGAARPAVLLVAALIAGIGGRAVPAFLASAAKAPAPPLDRAAQVLPVVVLAGAVWPPLALVGSGLALAQMRRWPWRGMRPAGALLVAGWLWLALGLALWGLAGLTPALLPLAGLHALAMGAMGGMIMAIGGRAGFPRQNGIPAAPSLAIAAGVALGLACLLRLAAVLTGDAALLLLAAALLWSLGWLVWLAMLVPHLRGPAIRPAFSGRVTPD